MAIAYKRDLATVAEMDGARIEEQEKYNRLVIHSEDGDTHIGLYMPEVVPTDSDWSNVADLVGMSVERLKGFTKTVARARVLECP